MCVLCRLETNSTIQHEIHGTIQLPDVRMFIETSDFIRAIIEASLSELHIDELNILFCIVHTSPTHHYRDCKGVRNIFQHDLEAA